METAAQPRLRLLPRRSENPQVGSLQGCRRRHPGLYDWNGVNQGNANGNHQAVVPDGQLCGDGQGTVQGLNLVHSDWPSTAIAPDASGNFQFVHKASARRTRPTIRLLHHQGRLQPEKPLAERPGTRAVLLDHQRRAGERHYRMNCPPSGQDRRACDLQRLVALDSPEAFYACIDVSFSGAVANPWQALGNLRAQQTLLADTTVTLRLFDAQGATPSVTARPWPRAPTVPSNGRWRWRRRSTRTPPWSTSACWMPTGESAWWPARRTTRSTCARPATASRSTSNCRSRAAASNRAATARSTSTIRKASSNTTPGTVVRGADGKRYQCKPSPEPPRLVQGLGPLLRPGQGMAWQDAWTLL